MNYKAVLFDLDGTLLPLNQDLFISSYFKALAAKLAPHGYDPDTLINNVLLGTDAMLRNDGTQTNEQAFWQCFKKLCSRDAEKDILIFDDFYRNEFTLIQSKCGYTPKAKELLNTLHAIGIKTVLATNPIFPAVATIERMRWAGISPDDFVLYTTYENIGYSKPNLNYYRDILCRLGLSPQDCLMVGNDVDDDMPAQEVGMDVFLLTDCLINRHNKDIKQYPHGNFDNLANYIFKDA